jgi:hypothetical protein
MSPGAWTGVAACLLLLGLSCAARSGPTLAADQPATGGAMAVAAEGVADGEPKEVLANEPPSEPDDDDAITVGERAQRVTIPCPPYPPTSDRQAEVDSIADLLIDGHPAAAKVAAEAILSGEAPPLIAARARRLLLKAQERLPPSPPPPPPFPAASFEVLQARIGSGFAAGSAGSLRLAEDGVSFLEHGSSRAAWALEWSVVLELVPDNGLWNTRYPLVLRERDGSSRYFALIGGDGDAIAPDPLLAAFGRARREAEARQAARAAGRPDGSSGKERKR